MLVGMSVFITAFAFALGMIMANISVNYPVTVERDRKVVLAFYGDYAIAAPFYPKAHAVGETLTVYAVGKTLPPFKVMEIGPLKRL